jgi:hypothetical protein
VEKSVNSQTGIVHAMSGKTAGPLGLKVAVCGWIDLFALVAKEDEEVTCTKCRSFLAFRKGLDKKCGA